MITVTKRHTFSAAHRLYDYNGKCEHLHGHNYKIEITITNDSLDELGMILDFAAVKDLLLTKLDALWDHKTLLFSKDPLSKELPNLLQDNSVCTVPFNPTAENMAQYLGEIFFPKLLKEAKCQPSLRITAVAVFETENNFASWVCDNV